MNLLVALHSREYLSETSLQMTEAIPMLSAHIQNCELRKSLISSSSALVLAYYVVPSLGIDILMLLLANDRASDTESMQNLALQTCRQCVHLHESDDCGHAKPLAVIEGHTL